MATPSRGGDSDKAIPQSLPQPSLMESCAASNSALLQQEDIVDQSTCSASNSALLQQLQQEDIVDQSPCSASNSTLLQQELLHGYRSDASDMSGRTDFSGATSFNRATSSGATWCDDSFWNLFPNPNATWYENSFWNDLFPNDPFEYDDLFRNDPSQDDDLFRNDPTQDDSFGLLSFSNDEVEEVETRREGRGEGEMEEGHLNSAGCLKKGKNTLGYDEVEEVGTRSEGRGEGEMEEGHLNSAGCLKKGKNTLGYDEVEEVETRSEGRGEGETEEGHLNSAWCLKKGKRKVRSPRGKRGNKKTTGARIEISLDDILQVEQKRLQEAARHLKVSASTLKRVCRDHGIHRWPPRMGKNCINQSGPSESLLAVDQEGIAQQRPDTPRSDTPSSSNTNSVIIKAKYVNDCTIKFRLSRPWVMVELEQQVQKRLKLEAGTYYIKYKDEDNDLIIIACDEDLQDYISSSIPRGTTSIEVLLVPK